MKLGPYTISYYNPNNNMVFDHIALLRDISSLRKIDEEQLGFSVPAPAAHH